jgi:hypothetical protein
MVLHDFLSKRLAPLQDRDHPAWMYTRVNDIIQLDHRSRSSLDEVLLATSLKALTTYQFSIELVVPPAVCEPIYANQAMRTTLLAAMPMLDDVDIASMQRGDQSRGVVIPEAGGLVGAAGGCGWGGGPAIGRDGVSVSGGHGGVVAGGRGSVLAGGPAPALGKDKHVHVILDDGEVLSDKDEPLQKQLRASLGVGGSSGSTPAAPDVVAMMKAAEDKDTVDKRAMEEVVVKAAADKEAADKRVTKEATMKEAAEGHLAGGVEPLGATALLAPAIEEGAWPGAEK